MVMRIAILLVCAATSGCDVFRPVDAAGRSPALEVAVFEGGYGIAWHQGIAAEYSAAGLSRVDLWGDPRVSEKVKPRLLRGDPPDLLLVHDLPIWMLIAADRLLPFDAVLDEPVTETGKTWRDMFLPGTLATYTSAGHTYAVPSALGVYSCWYDARLFREKGWAVPETWDALLALCEAIHAEGIAPFAYEGKYPLYGWWTFETIVQRVGGLEAIDRINALEPGAFTHADVIRAAGLFQELAVKHYQKGAMAMTHTESQLQFVNNKAAMITCGLWLPNEMKASTPDSFEMRCFNIPAIAGGKGDPRWLNGLGWEFMFVPADARRPEAAFDFAQYMVSPKSAPSMGSSIGVISPLKGATPREAVDAPLGSALDLVSDAVGLFDVRLDLLLIPWRYQVMEPAVAELLQGEITPEAFCARLEAGLEAVRQDPDAIVPPHTPYAESAA